MLDCFAQADSAGVRAHADTELCREQKDGDVLVHAGHPGGVNLEYFDGPCLQQLLEHHAVLHVLPCCHRDGCHAAGDGGVPEDVIRAGGFFDPGNAVRRQM